VSYYENNEEHEKHGIDYDLWGCLYYNPQSGFDVDDIDQVLAVYEGEHDGADYHWILQLKDERYIYLCGGCDYTGWDCQSSAHHEVILSPFDALGLVEVEDWRVYPTKDGIAARLLAQLGTGKWKTWREKMDKEFKVDEINGREPMLPQPKEQFTREVVFTPSTDEKIMYLVFLLKGSKGAVQFVLMTGWQITKEGGIVSKPLAFMGADIGYHSYLPHYEGQKMDTCQYLEGGKCYYDGSSLAADQFMPTFLAGGQEVVWEMLEDRYRTTFA
jgi:hypothetical protein